MDGERRDKRPFYMRGAVLKSVISFVPPIAHNESGGVSREFRVAAPLASQSY